VAEPYCFETGGERYALDRRLIEGVIEPEEIVTLPLSPDVLLGVAYWRGAFLPAVRTPALLGLPDRGAPAVLLMLRHEGRGVALAADAVGGGGGPVEPPPGDGPGPARGPVKLGGADTEQVATWLDARLLLDAAEQALAGKAGHPGQS